MPAKIHPLSDVQSQKIGGGTTVWQYAIILSGASIGIDCNINCHTFIENDVCIGNRVTIKAGVYLWDGIKIEDDVFIGPNATFVNNPSPRSKIFPTKHIGCTIEKGVSIGANATIMGNITIKKYSMIGAGSVLTKSTNAHELWFGNPANHKGYVTKDGIILDKNFTDTKTGVQYQFDNQKNLVPKQ